MRRKTEIKIIELVQKLIAKQDESLHLLYQINEKEPKQFSSEVNTKYLAYVKYRLGIQ